jgi:gamma-glutamylcyclotransferase (GGCT)/AIG2-like uncharacterized protein YtfP
MRGHFLFVYGTLRRTGTGGIHPLLGGCVQFVGAAHMPGKLYKIADYPGLVLSDNRRDRVRGEIYEIGRPDKLFSRLDPYEGCGPRFPPPTEYVRRKHEAILDDGTVLVAWVYLYNRSTAGLVVIENGDFLLRK